MIDYEKPPQSCQYGAQAQEYATTKLMWDDIQQLKADVKSLMTKLEMLEQHKEECKEECQHESEKLYMYSQYCSNPPVFECKKCVEFYR